MIAPLRTTMVTVWAACIAGAVVTLGLILGQDRWELFVVAGLTGLLAGVPLGLWNVRRMRAADPLARPESPTTDPDAARSAVDPARPAPYPPAPGQTYVGSVRPSPVA